MDMPVSIIGCSGDRELNLYPSFPSWDAHKTEEAIPLAERKTNLHTHTHTLGSLQAMVATFEEREEAAAALSA